jgi:hypothetical protein
LDKQRRARWAKPGSVASFLQKQEVLQTSSIGRAWRSGVISNFRNENNALWAADRYFILPKQYVHNADNDDYVNKRHERR